MEKKPQMTLTLQQNVVSCFVCGASSYDAQWTAHEHELNELAILGSQTSTL